MQARLGLYMCRRGYACYARPMSLRPNMEYTSFSNFSGAVDADDESDDADEEDGKDADLSLAL